VLLLFPGTGSDVADETVAVFETSWDLVTGGAVITSVIGGADPTASVGVVQVTTPAANPQLHPAPVALTKPEPAGSGSVTETDAAAVGPLFVTARVYGTGEPANATGGLARLAVFVIVRSALPVMKFVTSDSSVADMHCCALGPNPARFAACAAAAAFVPRPVASLAMIFVWP